MGKAYDRVMESRKELTKQLIAETIVCKLSCEVQKLFP